MFESILSETPAIWQILLCVGATALMSTLFSVLFCIAKRHSGYPREIAMTYAIFPIVICALALIINFAMTLYTNSTDVTRYGRVLIALLAVFVMIRFRSQQRTTEELTYIFFLTAIAMCNGLGYIVFGLMLYLIVVVLMIVLCAIGFPMQNKRNLSVKIVVPEDLNYEETFKSVMNKFTSRATLQKVKSKNFGTMFLLHYNVILKKNVSVKQFIDELRVLNGNLDITVTFAGINAGDNE